MSVGQSWIVVLGLGGEVLGVEHGAPPEWVGERLAERAGIPAALAEAARAVVLAARGGMAARARVEAPALGAAVELVAVAGVVMRRRAADVRALLHHAVAALEQQALALDVGLTVTVDAGVPPTITVDPEEIAWAIAALAGNAMRYVRRGTRHLPGGSIAVTARLDTVGAEDPGQGEIVIVVEDDGPGIPEPVLGRLFQRTAAAPYATGLALGVARDIVAAHGGSLALTSSTDEADHGTTVTVRLPIG